MSEAKPLDIVERAAAAIRGSAVPNPPAEVMAATFAAVQTQVTAARRARRRRRIMRNVSFGGLMACLAVAIGLVAFGDTAQGKPLLRALENQERAKSFRAVRRIAISEGETHVSKIYYLEGKMRVEEESGGYTISDSSTKDFVHIEPKVKVASVGKLELIEGAESEHSHSTDTVRQAIASKKLQNMGIQVIDGRRLQAYHYEGVPNEKANGFKPSATYWIDTKRNWVVRSESSNVSVRFRVRLNPKPGEPAATEVHDDKPRISKITTEYLGFDEDLDPALFDMTMPPGFQVQKSQIVLPPKQRKP